MSCRSCFLPIKIGTKYFLLGHWIDKLGHQIPETTSARTITMTLWIKKKYIYISIKFGVNSKNKNVELDLILKDKENANTSNSEVIFW